MARPNIDLSWLASLLTKTPTAEANPAFEAKGPGDVDFTYAGDPSAAIKKYGTTDAIIRPSRWQQLIHPDAASRVNAQADSFVTRPLVAKQTVGLENQAFADTLEPTRPYLPEPFRTASPIAVKALTGGDLRPTATGAEGRALLANNAGVFKAQSEADVAAAKLNLENTKAALNRADVTTAIADQRAGNDLAKELKVEPLAIENTRLQYIAANRRDPTIQELKDLTVANQIAEQKNVVPVQQKLDTTKIGNEQTDADTITSLAPYRSAIAKSLAVGNLYDATHRPVSAPFADVVNPTTGDVSVGQKVPGGMSQQDIQMRGMMDSINSLTGKGDTETITLPDSGKTIIVRKPAVSNVVNPLPSRPIIASTSTNVPVDLLPPLNPSGEGVRKPIGVDRWAGVQTDTPLSNLTERFQQIKQQLADPDFQERSSMYGEFAAKKRALEEELSTIQSQLGQSVKYSRPSLGSIAFPQ